VERWSLTAARTMGGAAKGVSRACRPTMKQHPYRVRPSQPPHHQPHSSLARTSLTHAFTAPNPSAAPSRRAPAAAASLIRPCRLVESPC
jgi:hypothetical protein